jgi:peroxiredoxin
MDADAAGAGDRYNTLYVGDPAPWFRQRCVGQTAPYSFDMAAGRLVVLCCYGSAAEPRAAYALSEVQRNRALFDGAAALFFGVSNDPADETVPRVQGENPGLHHFADFDGTILRLYGLLPRDGATDPGSLRRGWFVLDLRLRVIGMFPLTDAGSDAALRFVNASLPLPEHGTQAQVPVLILPKVFEPGLCAALIDIFLADGGTASGMFTEDAYNDAATIDDPGFKRRRDCRIADKAMVAQLQTRIFRRVVPELRHAFQFNATKLERLILACYDSAEGGRFGPHRDNTLATTAHRRFAVSINLNDDFEGGGIIFPEYGRRVFAPPLGGALLFSCSLLHAVLPVTTGRRYACLPFVYDDAAASARQKGQGVSPPGPPPGRDINRP